MNDEQGRALSLRRYLGARLLPLAALVATTVSLSAPVAFLSLRLGELSLRAEISGQRVADLIRREAVLRPALWRYDTIRLVEHLQGQREQSEVERLEITDPEGRSLGLGTGTEIGRLRAMPLVWGRAPILLDGERVGDVWVAVSAARVRRSALLLLAPFTALGLVLAALIYGIPLRAAGRAERRIGALVEDLDRSRRALRDRGEDLEREVAARSSALEAALADLQQKEARLRDVTSRAVALQEDERRAISRELHDGAGQALTAIRIHLQLLAAKVEGDAAKKLVERTTSMTDETIEEIRRAVRQLGPAILDEIGLAAALERTCDDFADRSRVELTRTIDTSGAALSAAVESACYRIAQEALTNVTRHAAARRVELRLVVEGERLVLTVKDDGRGFSTTASAAGRGLPGMRERAELLGGALTVTSSPGAGTTVRADVPLGERPASEV
jgi:signal transduction histidine kinase